MINPAYAQLMARYNAWQNDNLIRAAETLDDDARRAGRGAFFGSIHGTFCHVLWGDRMWLARFAPRLCEKPAIGIKESPRLVDDWADFVAQRRAMDETIQTWAAGLTAHDLDGALTWFSGALGREMTRGIGHLVVHMFNHQTHHRGQIHAMLTAAGARPEDTDLMLLEM